MSRAALSIPLLVVMLLQNQSCEQSNQQQKPATTPKRTGVAHRFILTKFDGGVAFDTQTGQICKTWDWQASGKQQKADDSGNVLPRTFGEFSPTCLYLYEQYPSGNSGGAVISDATSE